MNFFKFQLPILLLFLLTYNPIVYSQKLNIDIINDLENPLTLNWHVQGHWIPKIYVSPHGGVGQFTADLENPNPLIFARMDTESFDYDFTIYINITSDCHECAQVGCFWSVRQGGLYQLINGKWVVTGYWVPDWWKGNRVLRI